jgi:hypothetical protein
LNLTNRIVTALVATLLLGATLAFGGAVWWAPIALAILTFLFAIAVLARIMLEGELRILKSPLTFLGLLALGLAVVQLAPLPGRIAARLSPASYEVYTHGLTLRQARVDDPALEPPPAVDVRAPATLDRSATVRWLAGAVACLAVFWGVSQYTDRLGHLYVVWGSIVAGFFLNTAIGVVQLVSGAGQLYGTIAPGSGIAWAPSVHDLLTSPNTAALRPIGKGDGGLPLFAALVPDRPFLIGTLMGGPGAYLALGSIGLPLAVALLLQLIAPRGSREGLGARLGHSGQGGLVVLLAVFALASAMLVGVLAGPWLSLPFAAALILVAIPSAWPSGLRWVSVSLCVALLLALSGGVGISAMLAQHGGPLESVSPVRLSAAARVWSDSSVIVREFPVLGTGLGSFASVYPFYKSLDETHTTALSSLLQWVVESGLAGALILAVGVVWCLFRLPASIRRVGTADRALAFGLIGAAVGFSLYATVHWSVELIAVALAASAWGGTWNRWLAGATDLFIERA